MFVSTHFILDIVYAFYRPNDRCFGLLEGHHIGNIWIFFVIEFLLTVVTHGMILYAFWTINRFRFANKGASTVSIQYEDIEEEDPRLDSLVSVDLNSNENN